VYFSGIRIVRRIICAIKFKVIKMNLIAELKKMFIKPSVKQVLDGELHQAQMDLLTAEAHAEMYKALSLVYRTRIARLRQNMKGGVSQEMMTPV